MVISNQFKEKTLFDSRMVRNTRMATPSFYITNCTVADGDALGRNNMSAFWGDPNWRYVWKHTTLPHVIDAAAARGAHNLLRDRQVLRHFKCVDEATGQLVGYVRWKLPWTRYQHTKEGERNGGDEDKDNNRGSGPVSLLLWPEGQTPEVSDEERARIEERAAGAQWNPNATEPNDRIDEPLTARKRELMATKEYLRKSSFSVSFSHLITHVSKISRCRFC